MRGAQRGLSRLSAVRLGCHDWRVPADCGRAQHRLRARLVAINGLVRRGRSACCQRLLPSASLRPFPSPCRARSYFCRLVRDVDTHAAALRRSNWVRSAPAFAARVCRSSVLPRAVSGAVVAAACDASSACWEQSMLFVTIKEGGGAHTSACAEVGRGYTRRSSDPSRSCFGRHAGLPTAHMRCRSRQKKGRAVRVFSEVALLISRSSVRARMSCLAPRLNSPPRKSKKKDWAPRAQRARLH